jgi:hypothetical protein
MNKPARIFNGNVNININTTNFMNLDKIITEEQYLRALAEKIRIDKYLEHLTAITRAYNYQLESKKP